MEFKKHLISHSIGLMLNNLVYNRHGELHPIRRNDFAVFDNPQMGGDYGLYAIPLTKEILLASNWAYRKPGRYGGQDEWAGLGWWLPESIFNSEVYFRGHDRGELTLHLVGFFNTQIRYLHQLQNLYYALTGEELKYNPNEKE